jgi:hypothetical protein
MGVLDAPALSLAQARRQTQYGGWSVISNHPIKPRTRSNGTTDYGMTSRIECVPAVDIVAVRTVYANWYNVGTGESPNSNVITVKGAIQPAGVLAPNEGGFDPVYGSAREIVIGRGRQAQLEDIAFACAAGTRFWLKTFVHCLCPPPPAAPTAVGSAGGTLAAGTYGVCMTYVYPGGMESAASPAASVVVGASQQITVTSPANPNNGAIGYRLWMTTTGGSQVGSHYDTGLGVVPFATNPIITVKGLMSANVYEGIERVDPTGKLFYPTSDGTMGGTGAGANNNGEAAATNFDRVLPGNAVDTTVGANFAINVFGPIAILGLTPTRVARSVAVRGDSIAHGTGDSGYGPNGGGWVRRAAMGQLAAAKYDATIVPLLGHLSVAQPSETLTLGSGVGGTKRRRLASLATSVWSGYGTNDIGLLSMGAAPLAALLQADALVFTGQGKTYLQADLLPKTVSTDGFQTIANQTLQGGAILEGHRRAFNNWLASATGAVPVVNEAPLRGAAGSKGPTYDLYGGGDAVTTVFVTAHPFRQGTEAVTVNGVAKVITTDYTYLQTQTINGIAYASGITFLAAPANAADVRIGYTKLAGMQPLLGALAKYTPITVGVERDSAGVAARNGGWWRVSDAPILGPRTPTATTTGVITDSAQAWAIDQYRGYCVLIVTDTTTPAAVGQVRCIQYNTATQLVVTNVFTTLPSVAATYVVLKSYSEDGIHPSSFGAMALAVEATNSLALVA